MTQPSKDGEYRVGNTGGLDKISWPLRLRIAPADDFLGTFGVQLALFCPPGWETYGESPVQRVVSFNLEPVNKAISFSPPTTFLTQEGAQEVMDQLWNIGFRPKRYETPGQIPAMEAHIKDLQAIAGQLLNLFTERERAMFLAGAMKDAEPNKTDKD